MYISHAWRLIYYFILFIGKSYLGAAERRHGNRLTRGCLLSSWEAVFTCCALYQYDTSLDSSNGKNAWMRLARKETLLYPWILVLVQRAKRSCHVYCSLMFGNLALLPLLNGNLDWSPPLPLRADSCCELTTVSPEAPHHRHSWVPDSSFGLCIKINWGRYFVLAVVYWNQSSEYLLVFFFNI